MEVLLYLLKSAAILTIFYIVYVVLLRKETHFVANRIYLLAGAIGSFLLPLVYFTRTVYVEAPVSSSGFFSSEITPLTANILVETIYTIDWLLVAVTIYFIGILVVLIRFVQQLASLLRLLNSGRSKKINGFRYLQVSESIAPFSFFSYIVYNPNLHTEQHEQAHSFQWHSADIILANILVMLQWANPLAWGYKKSVEENLEFLADNATASRVPSKKDYQLALVKASSALYTPALTTNFYKSFTRLTVLGKEVILGNSFGQIKKRIIMLNKSTSKRHNLLKIAVVLPFVALFLYGFNTKEIVVYKENPSEKIKQPTETTLSNSENSSDRLPRKEEKINAQFVSEIKPEIARPNEATLQKEEIKDAIVPKTAGISINAALIQEVRFKITKNTTDADMRKLKEELMRDHKIDLSYDIVRNDKNEITSISLQYTGQGRNGSYNISDDDAIDDFYFYMNEEGESGFWSEDIEERQATRGLTLSKRRNNNNRMKEEIIVEREEIRNKMTERKKVMRAKMKVEREKMRVKREEVIIEREKLQSLMDEEKKVIENYEIIRNVQRNTGKNDFFVISGSNNGQLIRSSGSLFGHTTMINENTTDAELTTMKTNLSAKGIDFNYSKVRRNNDGEITRIKIEVNNNKGRKQTITASGDDGAPIDNLIVNID